MPRSIRRWAGPAPTYTTDELAARLLIPKGFEWQQPVYSAGSIYAACRRTEMDDTGLNRPHAGQWGCTLALAMCGAAIRGYVLARGAAQV